jgi:ATP-dependent Clp endopeptidase proteolytic subunit ClpP
MFHLSKKINKEKYMSRIVIPLQTDENFSVEQPPKELRVYLTEAIEPKGAKEIVERLYAYNEFNVVNIENPSDYIPIRLIINSPGGDLQASQMICDVMDEIETPVSTCAYGQACSGGLMIFMNGTKGTRTATTSTQFMSHRFIMGMEGSHTEFKIRYKEMDRIHERLVQHYAKCTGLTAKRIEKELLNDHDVWLTSEDCKKFGIVDLIRDNNRNFDRKK